MGWDAVIGSWGGAGRLGVGWDIVGYSGVGWDIVGLGVIQWGGWDETVWDEMGVGNWQR